MTSSLPERPDLDQLRRQAKELRDAVRRRDLGALERFGRHYPSPRREDVSLAAAQLAIARELGFSSWPQLKAAVDAAAATPDGGVPAFLAASIEGRPKEAAIQLRADPGIAGRSMRAAAVLGDTEAMADRLGADPEAALSVDDDRGWPPLLYACYSRWHQIAPDREAGLAQVVRLLLAAGARPDTNNGAFRQGYRSALVGAVEANNPAVVQVLLESGANPDDGRCIAQAADRTDHRCLELLVSHGARVTGTWALGAAVYADDHEAVSILLEALRAAGGDAATDATNALADAAAANSSTQVVGTLLAAGADPDVRDSDVGLSALRCAIRAGHADTAALLVRHGASDDSTEVDVFLGACRTADRSTVRRLLTQHPDLPDRLSDDDRAAMVGAAASVSPAAMELMLESGLSPHDRNGLGEQPLHTAANLGNTGVVRVLLGAGADVDGRDDRFHATPLAYATVGSGEHAGEQGDWIGTVRQLVEAGASMVGVWVSEKPPNEEVMDLLRSYGITPDEPDETDDPTSPDRRIEVAASSIDNGVMADLARHLEAAYRDFDLDLLGSLLHPEVRWTGLCRDRAQVLDWYRGFQAEGVVPMVQSVEVHGDAVVLGLVVSRPAEGARPAPPEELYQVFTIEGAEIVDIRAYPDRVSALGRS